MHKVINHETQMIYYRYCTIQVNEGVVYLRQYNHPSNLLKVTSRTASKLSGGWDAKKKHYYQHTRLEVTNDNITLSTMRYTLFITEVVPYK